MSDNNDLNALINSIDHHPDIVNEEIHLQDYKRIPFAEMASLGVASESFFASFGAIFGTGAESGLYHVQIPPNTHLARFHSDGKLMAVALSNKNNQIVANARLTPAMGTPLTVDPVQIGVAIALMSITQRLDESIATGKEILAYLKQQDEAKLIGNINFLTEAINNYKLSRSNKQYVDSHLPVIHSIRHEAEQSIALHKKQAETIIKDGSGLHFNKQVQKKLGDILTACRHYQLALYLYAFSSFTGIMFEESFSSEYLNTVKEKIRDYSTDYKLTYTSCSNFIEKYFKSSVRGLLLKGASKLSQSAGNVIAKTPIGDKTQIDERLISTGKAIDSSKTAQTENIVTRFAKLSDPQTERFISSIETVDKTFNSPIELAFDKENLYIKSARN